MNQRRLKIIIDEKGPRVLDAESGEPICGVTSLLIDASPEEANVTISFSGRCVDFMGLFEERTIK